MAPEEMKEGLEVVVTDPLLSCFEQVVVLLWKFPNCNLWAIGNPNTNKRLAIADNYLGPSQCEPIL
jgi:hypothetical protein